MKTRLLTITLACLVNFSFAQILVDQTIQLEEIPNMFLGDDYEISNITFQGDPTQIGIFFGNQSNLGIDLGLTLGTGNVNLVTSAASEDPMIQGPGGNNQSGGSLGGGNFGSSDEDLVTISGGLPINDAAVLEFDFVAPTDNVTFEYIFASEEYPEYACTNFNDAFGFFLSGPGINGEFSSNAANVAVVPDTDPPVYVNIDNINDMECGMENVQYYVNNSEINSDPNIIEYDGFTTVLPIDVTLVPGETYHMKLAIGDASDTVFDSAVFIRSSTSVFVWTETEGTVDGGGMTLLNESQLMEGCFNGEFDIYLSYAASSTITDFSISGTATMGEDFEDISDLLSIPNDFVGIYTLPITVMEDTEDEGEETVIVSLSYMDEFGDIITVTEEMTILEKEDLDIDIEPVYTFCSADTEIEINAMATSGIEPIVYEWSNDSEEALQLFTQQDVGTHTVNVTDHCGNQVSQDILLELAQPLELIEDEILCTEEYSSDIILSGSGPFEFNFDDTSLTQDELAFGSSLPGIYTVEVSDICGEAEAVQITVEVCNSIDEITESDFTLLNLGSEIQISTTLPTEQMSVSIYGVNGQLISRTQAFNAVNRIDISNLSSGLYILEISENGVVLMSEKILK